RHLRQPRPARRDAGHHHAEEEHRRHRPADRAGRHPGRDPRRHVLPGLARFAGHAGEAGRTRNPGRWLSDGAERIPTTHSNAGHPMGLKKGIRQLVANANARIATIPVEDAKALLGDPGVQFVDIRDVRELEREGMVPGAFHAPRGMLEFWADPDSPYFKTVFGEDRRFGLYCQSGWRSALAAAALQDMGLGRVAHVAGGFNGWKAGSGEVAQKASRAPAAGGQLRLPATYMRGGTSKGVFFRLEDL